MRKAILSVLMIGVLSAWLPAQAANPQFTWTNGGADNVWSNPANWSGPVPLVVPSYDDDVLIDATAAVGPSSITATAGNWTQKWIYDRPGEFTMFGGYNVATGIEVKQGTLTFDNATGNLNPWDWDAASGYTFTVAAGARLNLPYEQSFYWSGPVTLSGGGTLGWSRHYGHNLNLVIADGGTVEANQNYAMVFTGISGTNGGTINMHSIPGDVSAWINSDAYAWNGQFNVIGSAGHNNAVQVYGTGALVGAKIALQAAPGATANLYRQGADGFTAQACTFSGNGRLFVTDSSSSPWRSLAQTMTAQGTKFAPGTATEAGVMEFWGDLALAKNGTTNSSLDIKIMGTGNVAGTDNDQLLFANTFPGNGETFLNGTGGHLTGLENTDLNLSIASGLTPAGAYTILSAYATDLTAMSFANVAGGVYNDGTWTAVVHYNLHDITVDTFAAAPPANILGDCTGDGYVDDNDLGRLLGNWGLDPAVWADGNFNSDTVVDDNDLGALLGAWGNGTPPGAVPEPVTLSLLALGGMALLRRR